MAKDLPRKDQPSATGRTDPTTTPPNSGPDQETQGKPRGPLPADALALAVDEVLVELLSPGMRTIVESCREGGCALEQLRQVLRKKGAPQHLINGVEAYWNKLDGKPGFQEYSKEND